MTTIPALPFYGQQLRDTLSALDTAIDGKESTGTAATAVSAHVAAADPHPQYLTPTEGNAAYAPVAQGVTNGNSHDHNGGDGAQIAYSSLSGLPTLPTGTNTGDQALSNTSNATSHTVTLSGSGGSLQLVEGSNVTLTTSGTASAAVVTIAASVPGGGGTVTSIGLIAPTGFSLSGSPVTTSGDITLAFAAGYSLPTTASQTSWDTAFTERRYWDGGATGLSASTARTSLELTAIATANLSGGLALVGGLLVPGEVVKLIVSDFGETGITTGNFKREIRMDRPFVVVGVWWNCHPTAMGSASTSDARPYIRTSAGTTSAGTKINLLTSTSNIASLAASAHTVDATSSISGGTYSGSAGDWLGVDLMSLGTGSSGHQLTYLLRYS